MQKTLALLSCILIVSLANAQFVSDDREDRVQWIEEKAHLQLPENMGNKVSSEEETLKAAGDTIWYEDFGGGFPSSWSIQDSTGICPWSYTLDGTWGFWNGNNGTGPGDDTLQSATKSNGYLICDPDSANNALYGQPSGSTYQYLSSYFTTSAIDLSGYPAVHLQFEHLFRFNNGIDLIVGVSADGTNWTNYTVQGNTPNNTQSANAALANLNISTVAGNQSTVYIRIGWSARVYYWMIDDIRIVEAPDNDLTVTMEQHYPFYKMTPVRQTTGIKFTGAIANNGGNTQANVQLNTTVTLLGDTTFNDSSAPMSFAPSAIDTVTILDSSYAPALLGDYIVEYYVTYDSTDFDPSDDSLANNFAVTDSVYARDDDTYTGWGVRTSTGGTKQRGILYDIWQQDTLSSISVLITGSTPPTGEVVQFHLYDTTLLFPIASSTFYTIQPSDLGNWITLSFAEFVMTPGQYIATIESFSDSVYVHFDPDAPLPLPQTAFYLADDGNWYYSTSYTYFVRMNTKRPVCNANIVVTTTNSTCDSSDAMAYVVASGGLMPYTYSWDTSPVQTSDTATGLAAGIYTLTVNDGLGCFYTEQVTIIDSGAANLTLTSTAVSCAGLMDGTASVMVSGGLGPFTYVWSSGSSDSIAINLVGGTYDVTVQGADNCISVSSVDVVEPDMAVVSTSATDISCAGLADGTVTASIIGGTAPYTYVWSNAAMGTSVTGLVAGVYGITVEDNNGCLSMSSATILEPAVLIFDTTGTTPDNNNNADGSISTSVSGGTGAYTYSWNTSPVQTTANATGLAAGTYMGFVTDENGCQDSVTATIALVIGIADTPTNSTLNIYPNPTTGMLHIEFNDASDGAVEIELFNIVGERVLSESSKSNDLLVDLSRFNTGVYFLKAITSEGVLTHKILRN